MDTFCCIILCSQITDWLSIGVDLLTGGIIAIVLAYVVPKKLNDDRSLKDFFIQEFQSIKNEHNDFCRDMCLGKLDAPTIKELFKQLNLKLNDIQAVANRNLDVGIDIMDELSQIQIFVTSSEEINDQFTEESITFSSITRNQIWRKQDVFNKNIISAIAAINKARSK